MADDYERLPDIALLRRRTEDVEAPGASKKRSPSPRRWLLLFVPLTALLILGGIGVADIRWPLPDDIPEGVEPQPLGPEVLIAEGDGWRVLANKSDQGLCLHIETDKAKGGGCGFGVPAPFAIGYSETVLPQTNTSFINGPTRKDISLVKLVFYNRRPLRTSVIWRREFDVNFYAAQLPPGVLLRAVVGYDRHGQVVERVESPPSPRPEDRKLRRP